MFSIIINDYINTNILEVINMKKQKCHYCGLEKENCFNGHMSMTLPDEGMEAKINKWGRKYWWENLERDDLTDEEFKELDLICIYDQALNTIGKGVMCNDCIILEDELYSKYYPSPLNNEKTKQNTL